MSVIASINYEPPDTATPELEDEPTDVDEDWTPDEVVVVAVDELVVDACEEDVTPGTV